MDQQYKFPLADIVDAMSIVQLKEALWSGDSRKAQVEQLKKLSHDLDLVFEERQIQWTGRLIRLIVLVAQANLHIWTSKEQLQDDDNSYSERLDFAQDMNNLRNHARNLLLEQFKEYEHCRKKASFHGPDCEEWYLSILDSLRH